MSKGASLRVPSGLHWQSRFFGATAGAWNWLGNIETSALKDEISGIQVTRPIYVTSLARAGTTILTEMLEQHPDVTSHHYSDFPNVWTPYWRNYLLQNSRRETPRLEERAHKDRIQVSNDSPEAVEEVLWMRFFPGWHDSAGDQVLDGSRRNAEFDAFYRDNMRKLLAVRGCTRYLAKGNYNIARLRYIRSMFPDARFVVPLRDPVHHIASMAKQHALFLAADAQDPRVSRQLALSGHFEFGPQRRFIHFGNNSNAEAIRACWNDGREVEGWARYWAATYSHLEGLLREDEELREAVFLFRYEDLCSHSGQLIDALLSHCGLEGEVFKETRTEYNKRLTLPDYYQIDFSTADLQAIHEHCNSVYAAIGEHCLRPV